MTARRLRDYQDEDTERVRAAWDRGIARPAIVWATGLGKSDPVAVLAVEEARRGGRVLLLAHRGELLSQLRDRCRAYAPDIRVGRVQAGSREYDAPIVTATVQTASRPDRRARMHRPTLLIVDEAHHAAAKTYVTIMRWAGCYDETDPCRALGVTATMDRADKPVSEITPDVKRRVDLGDVWQEIVAERGIVWGIEHGPDPADPWRTLPVWQGDGDAPAGYAPDGWLVPLIGRVVVGEHVDLSNAKISRTTKDYADNDLGVMVAQDAPEVVKAWWTHALLPDGSHRQTGVFVPTLHAARAYLDAFTASGIATEMVDGDTKPEIRGDVHRRTGIYGRVADGRTQVLVSVGVLTEGWDCPPVSCIMVARPTQLAHLYQQMVGRGTRQMDPRAWLRHDGTPFAPKRDCLVFDVVGTTRTGSVHLRTLAKLIPGVPYIDRPCEVCGQPKPCGCVAEPTEDPDGGRIDNRRRLTGPADYEPIDLLAGARESGLNWLRTIPGDGYEGIPFLTAGRFYGILWHNEDHSWSGGWVTNRGAHDGGWIIESVTEHEARAAVEALWLDGCDGPLGTLAERRDAPWRLARKSPSPRQLAFARSLGVVNAETLTAGACGDEIDRVLATRRLVRDF